MSSTNNEPLKTRQKITLLGRLMGRAKHKVDPNQQPFLAHLMELRDRVLNIVKAVVLVFLILSPFADELYSALAKPLIASLPAGSTMIATEVASPFLAPFKFAFVLAMFLSMPIILYQAWAFVAPGLYASERKIVLPLMVSSSVLFYVGMAFAYFVVFPLAFAFLMGTAPEGVAVMTDITHYLDFTLKMFFAFGVAFEVPVATFLLVRAGVTTVESLAEMRRYVVVGAFVFGAIFTPPDVISQTLLAVPLLLLFELGLYVTRRVQASEKKTEADEANETKQ